MMMKNKLKFLFNFFKINNLFLFSTNSKIKSPLIPLINPIINVRKSLESTAITERNRRERK